MIFKDNVKSNYIYNIMRYIYIYIYNVERKINKFNPYMKLCVSSLFGIPFEII